MPFRHISPDLKERAVWLKNNGWLTGNICAILGISDKSLRRWCQNVEQFGNVVPVHNPLRGRPSTLDAFQVHELIEMLNETPEVFLDEICDWVLVSQDVGLSRSAINKIIEDLGFTYKYMKKVAVERDEDGRRQWMEAIRAEFVAEQMVFVDESSKDDRTSQTLDLEALENGRGMSNPSPLMEGLVEGRGKGWHLSTPPNPSL